jgi:predicted nuclease of restriction endonuclease-like RecB superfamily
LLKSELIRPRLVIRDGQVRPRRLPADYRYLTIAGELAELFLRQVGRSRGTLAEALRDYEGDSLDYPVIRGLAAVLEGRCTFASPESILTKEGGDALAVSPSDLRAELFRQGPVTEVPDLFSPTTRERVLAETADRFGLTVEGVETAFFADLAEEQILVDPGEPLAPGDLIARYNLEVARGVLYWAREVRLVVGDGYKDLFKFVKLFRLMYSIAPLQPPPNQGGGKNELPSPPSRGGIGGGAGGYHITLHGPISPFVKSTIRYGLQFAKFLPALLLCESWEMEADVQPPGVPGREPLLYTLDDGTDLRTHFKSSGPYDSQLEADFAAEFEAKYGGDARRGWELARDRRLLAPAIPQSQVGQGAPGGAAGPDPAGLQERQRGRGGI